MLSVKTAYDNIQMYFLFKKNLNKHVAVHKFIGGIFSEGLQFILKVILAFGTNSGHFTLQWLD